MVARTTDALQFICNELAEEYNLSKRRWQFDKVELTGSDVIVLIETWYIRANVLLYTPYTTQTFHFYILVEAITGCRPGCLGEMKWEDFTIFLLYDSKANNITPGATISLMRNKQLQGSTYIKERCVIYTLIYIATRLTWNTASNLPSSSRNAPLYACSVYSSHERWRTTSSKMVSKTFMNSCPGRSFRPVRTIFPWSSRPRRRKNQRSSSRTTRIVSASKRSSLLLAIATLHVYTH